MPMPVSAPPVPLNPDSPANRGQETGLSAHGGDGFGDVVAKYSRLVFSTVLRRTGDEEGAKEVTQNVFLMACRKLDELKNVKRPAAWFHRAAMLESSNYLRAERRRRKHLEKFASEHGEPVVVPLEEGWRGPLDEALNALGESERELVLGRYFEGCSFQELAGRRDSTPDAVRVRLTRILEKLSAVLKRRGVAVSITGLAGVLGSQWAHAAPAGLTAAVTATAAASGTAPVSLFVAMTSAKSISLTVLALLLAGFSLGTQSARTGDLKRKLEERRSGGMTAARFESSRAGTVSMEGGTIPANAPAAETPGEEWEPLTAQSILKALRDWPFPRSRGTGFTTTLDKALEKLSVDEIRKLLRELDSAEGGANFKNWVRSSLISYTLSRKDPEAAVQEAIRRRMSDEVFLAIAKSWTKQNREAAVKGLLKMLENPDALPAAKFGADPAGALREGLAASLSEQDLSAMIQLCRTTTDPAAATDYLAGMAKELGMQKKVDTMFELLSTIPAGMARTEILANLAEPLYSYHGIGKPMRDFLDHPQFPQEVRKDVVLRAALDINARGIDDNNPFALELIKNVSKAEDETETLLAWLRQANPPKEPLRLYPANEEKAADEQMESVLRRAVTLDPAAAQRWVVSIHDPDRRARVAGELKLTAP